MHMDPVNSSHLDSVGFDLKRSTMRVKFRNGAVHEFSNVSERDHKLFMASPSKGKSLHEMKGRCPSCKIS